MNEQGPMLVNAFRIGSLVVGIPSAAGSIGFGLLSVILWIQRPEPVSSSAKVSESLVNVIVVMAGWFAKVIAGILGLVEGLVHIAAAVSFGGVLLAALLFVTSRGLAVNALWARGVAGLMLLVALLAGALLMLTVGAGLFRLVGLAVTAFSGYAIWLLWRGIA